MRLAFFILQDFPDTFLLQVRGAREKLTKENAEDYFALCGARQGLRAPDLRELFEKSSAKTFIPYQLPQPQRPGRSLC